MIDDNFTALGASPRRSQWRSAVDAPLGVCTQHNHPLLPRDPCILTSSSCHCVPPLC